VSMHEPLTNLRKLIILQMKDPSESEIWRALRASASRHQAWEKLWVAVDEDIDPEDMGRRVVGDLLPGRSRISIWKF